MRYEHLNKVALGVLLIWAVMAGYALVESFGFFDKGPEQENFAFEKALGSIGESKISDTVSHNAISPQDVSLLPVLYAQPQLFTSLHSFFPPVPSNCLSSPSGSSFVLKI